MSKGHLLLSFFIPVEPVPMCRPKIAVRGRRAIAYYNKKVNKHREDVALFLTNNGYKTKKPLDCPLVLELNIFLNKPKSAKRVVPYVRPDIDNYLKMIMDALNPQKGDDIAVIKDDSLIVSVIVNKLYATERVGWDVKIYSHALDLDIFEKDRR